MGLTGSLHQVKNIDETGQLWSHLSSKIEHSFFVDWLWLKPWTELILKNSVLYLYEARKDGQVVALCFLTLSKIKRSRGVISCNQIQINECRKAEFDMTSQYNGMLCSPEMLQPAWINFMETLERSPISWDELKLSSLPEDQVNAVQTAIGTKYHWAQDENHLVWKVPLTQECADETKLLSGFKRKSRQQLKQSLNAIRKQWGEIRINKAEDLDTAFEYFDQMAIIHTERWNRVGEEGAFAQQNWTEFHRQIISSGFPQGKILLFKIDTVQGNLLGYLYGFVHNKEAIMQQTGFVNSSINAIRPGYVSHFFGMMLCAEQGLECYDFLPDPSSSYKKFFCAPIGEVTRARIQKSRFRFKLENRLKQYLAS